MKAKLLTIAIFSTILCNAQIATQTRDDAGLQGSQGTTNGFFETKNPINYPFGAASWWHLLDVRHSNPANNYAMQFSGSFFDQNLWFRKTNNNPSQPWQKVLMVESDGSLKTDYTLNIVANEKIPVISGNGGYIPTGLRFVDNSYNQPGQVKEWSIWKGNTWLKGLAFMRYDAVNRCAGGICDVSLFLSDNGNIGIGSMAPQNKLDVNGTIHAKEVKVDMNGWADYVFKKEYQLPSLREVEKHINETGHLPNIPTEKEVLDKGLNLGDFQIKLLQKIEELTLYTIQLNKDKKALEEHNTNLNNKLDEMQQRLEHLEKTLLDKKGK